ncbi:hypothetical protein CERSUDRAFT_121966 [Gelatoporia subvermispora B]|uniref:F-box domain-containing protein n=1 Tax=Ceriporiopsis subvermispora (strain B) TaxID=914234 RepID=M2R5C3_CERS8|nr:hypothetical protein CERSUDRAFT_121966 [Gelatoporia subvermispora B]
MAQSSEVLDSLILIACCKSRNQSPMIAVCRPFDRDAVWSVQCFPFASTKTIMAKRRKVTRGHPTCEETPAIIPQRDSFSSVPVELLLTIVDYVLRGAPKLPLPPSATSQEILPGEYAVRYDLLRTLTWTCRTLREICLPILWQHVETCVVLSLRSRWYNAVTNALRVRCKAIKLTPEIHPLIQTFTVSLSRPGEKGVFRSFVACLESLPNLHTLIIIHMSAASKTTCAIQRDFKKKRFPQIRKLVLPDAACAIVQCCPEVREIEINKGGGLKVAGAAEGFCPNIEIMYGMQCDVGTLEAVVQGVPSLREIWIREDCSKWCDPMGLRLLSNLQQLSAIVLSFYDHWEEGQDRPNLLDNTPVQAYLQLATGIFQRDGSSCSSVELTKTWSVRDLVPGHRIRAVRVRVERIHDGEIQEGST